ncbi:hypothetical protein [Ancylobacter pratisalsi]|uniref:Uncharacterized protein n=1 Tax=Ancylobacter pratisalsi TaxID=1745854 RepID=A0A6P1YJU5_9HYPH|nr:hypothetical protein [Ancylobacter pratisalsi]QIB32961.1 hypothetical protein G3A50_03970 [Ancylobacter pratisalsi]
MSAIEPNIISLLWFTLFSTLCCIGFLALSGSFPLNVARERGRSSNAALAIFNVGLMAILAALTLAYGYVELRISSVIVITGLAILFAPASFEIWPERWRDGRGVLATLLVLQVVAIAALCQVGGNLLAPIS